MFKQITGVALFLIVLAIIWPSSPVKHGPGVVAPNPPLQKNISAAKPFEMGVYQITPLANFTINARILRKESYFIGPESDLSPVDFALGWGRMSDESVLSHFSITQRGRWYRWRADELIIPRREVETSSANMHMIPANNTVKLQLRQAKEGNVVTIVGKLVAIEGPNNWRWRSSLTREDTGGGACELIWVESMVIE